MAFVEKPLDDQDEFIAKTCINCIYRKLSVNKEPCWKCSWVAYNTKRYYSKYEPDE